MAAQVVPEWPAGTVATLITGSRGIPVSTAVRVGESAVRFGLGRRRGSLERIRAEGRCALVVVAAGLAVTLYGSAREAGEVEGVVAVEMEVDEVVDHTTALFRIDAGVAWEWTDEEAAARDRAVRAGLAG